jgi:lipopolysaccharide/colanic/teichoic acid biosynthesis glycosyltransferase
MFLKFRSMYTAMDREQVAHANEKQGHIFKIKDDPRVTRIGGVIRRYSLDELPQLINVLRGEMSLVGPRPLPAGDLGPDGMSVEFADWSEGRSLVYPGITGLWQVNGRSELPFEEMVRFDLQYIREWSLLLDIKIILATPGLVVKGVGAY